MEKANLPIVSKFPVTNWPMARSVMPMSAHLFKKCAFESTIEDIAALLSQDW